MVNPFDEEKEANQPDEQEEYVFRFGIHFPQEENNPEPLVDFVRCQLADLLKVIVLTHNGERVKVNGFLFLNDTEKEHKIWVDKRI